MNIEHPVPKFEWRAQRPWRPLREAFGKNLVQNESFGPGRADFRQKFSDLCALVTKNNQNRAQFGYNAGCGGRGRGGGAD